MDGPFTKTEVDNSVYRANAMAPTGLSGFDRLDADTKICGIIQFCYSASSQEVHQIDEDGTYSLLTSQTTFADGSTAIADRTLAIYHVSGETSFKYWYQGTEVEVPGIKTVQAPDDGGGYIYFNSDGDLQYNGGTAFNYIVKETLVSYVGWNTTENEFNYFADERHGISMNPVTHLYNHSTHGFAWGKFGSDITGLANNVSTFDAVTMGQWADEDLDCMLVEVNDAPFIYREGADGQWRMTIHTDALGLIPAGTLVWNNEDEGGSGVWGLEDATSNNDYMVTTFWATNNKLAPIVKSVSQAYFGSRNDARDQLDSLVHKIQLDGLPSPEMNPIGSMIVHNLTAGQIEVGSNGEIWVDHRYGTPNGRFD